MLVITVGLHEAQFQERVDDHKLLDIHYAHLNVPLAYKVAC